MLLFGIDKQDVTPDEPCHMAGYSRTEKSSSVLDPIQINSICYTIHDETFILTVLDSIMLEPEFCNRVKAGIMAITGILAEHITCACIHTHSAPAYFKLAFEDTHVEPELTAKAEQEMVESAIRAWSAQRPARVVLEKMQVNGIYGNRNVKGGVEDKNCYLITFFGCDGDSPHGASDHSETPLGAFFNISAHPTILNGSSTALSADLIGQVRLRLERKLGCPVLCTNGTCGDVSTRFYRKSSGMDELIETADALFEQIVEKKSAASLADGPVFVGGVELPTTYDAQTDADWLEMTARIDADLASNNPSPMASFFKTRQEIKRAQSPIHLNLLSQIYIFGNLIVVTLPGDICSELGARIKAAFPSYETIIIGYANTYCNYLVPEADYGKYFETYNARTRRGEPDRFIARVIGTIESLIA